MAYQAIPGRRTILAGAAAAIGLGRTARADPVESIIETRQGKLRGLSENGTFAFKGVRYGETTGGANRFLPPVPVIPWAGVRDATAFGASAPQLPGGLGPLGGWYAKIEPVSEDCLFLNVWTPGLRGARRPVMVWLHGGGWASCAGTAPGFNGAHLARTGDVVVVTINHRLNGFGYLALEGGDPRFADSGNAGVLDMVAALRWVRDNIAGFGGDPRNVTIFGQSGGAAKVTALMGMPAAHGLFHKAIVESCSGGLRLDGVEEAHRQTRDLGAKLGLSVLSGEALQAVPMDKLIAAIRSVPDPFRPVKDGRSFSADPFDPTAPPTAANVPLMIGNAANEATFFMAATPANFALDAPEVERRVARYLDTDEAATRRIIDAYRAGGRGTKPSELLAAIATDYMYRRNTTRVAALQAAAAKAPVFAYVFDWKTPVMEGVLASPHTIEVPFVFGTVKAAQGLVGSGPELPALVKTTMEYWTSFAHCGEPCAKGAARWTPYDLAQKATMLLDVTPRIASDPDGDSRGALDDLPYFEYSRPASFTHA